MKVYIVIAYPDEDGQGGIEKIYQNKKDAENYIESMKYPMCYEIAEDEVIK